MYFLNFFFRYQSTFYNQFEPVLCFTRFFSADRNFIFKIGFTDRTIRLSIVSALNFQLFTEAPTQYLMTFYDRSDGRMAFSVYQTHNFQYIRNIRKILSIKNIFINLKSLLLDLLLSFQSDWIHLLKCYSRFPHANLCVLG